MRKCSVLRAINLLVEVHRGPEQFLVTCPLAQLPGRQQLPGERA